MVVYTLEQYTALSDAISQGVMKVKYFDKEVEYRSLDDMLRILALMKAQLFPNQNNGRRYVSFSKGTGPKRGGRNCGNSW
jgi:hypothetical protein